MDESDELDWLEPWFGSRETGCLIKGFDAQIRVLHSMWENPNDDSSVTHHEVNGGEGLAGLFDDVPALRGRTVLTGVTIGPATRPSGWARLEWHELAERLGVNIDITSVRLLDAFSSKLKEGSWPASIQPPPEGSLDWDSYQAVFEILEKHSTSKQFFRVSPPNWGGDDPPNTLHLGTATELLNTYGEQGSGINWWPVDHSWLVYTDYDLNSSIVQGSNDLIAELAQHHYLETTQLTKDTVDTLWIPNLADG